MKSFKLFLTIILFTVIQFSYAQSPKKLKKLADKEFNLHHYQEAISGYSKVINLDPDNYKALNNRAICYEKTKQIQNAINDYLICHKIDYKEKEIYLKIADLYIQLNDFKNANAILEKLLTYDKWNTEGLRKSSWCHIILKEFDLAIVKADRAIDKETNTDGQGTEIAHYYRGLAKDSLKDYNAAILSYKRAITILKSREVNRIMAKPGYKPYYVNLATALYKTKKYDESIKNYEIALQVDQADTIRPENYYIYYLKSFPFLSKSDFNAAIGDLNRAIVLNGKSAMLFFQRGTIYKQTSQYQSAISDFTKTIILDELNANAFFYRAQCQMELGNYKEVINDAKQTLKLNSKNNDAIALLKTAEEKNYIANKESDAPQLRWEYPSIDQNNFINVYVNQLNVLLEANITDKSLIKSITVNNKEIVFNNEELNPELNYKLSADNLKKIDISVTDIYNNTTKKTIKVGKIVSETRAIVNLEGIILSNDSSMNPLANKRIFITNQKGEIFYTGVTSEKGYFKFENIPIDKNYLIELEETEVSMKNKGFVLADKNGKVVMSATRNAKEKNKFSFELLKTDITTMSLMSIDDLPLLINIGGKLIGLSTTQIPLANINLQLIKENGEVLIKKTDDNGFFNFINLNPNENYTFKISEEEAKNINVSTIIIADYNGKIIKTISKNNFGFFEYKILTIEKTQLSSISEPDPWMKSITLNKDKNELTIIENIYYESGSFTVPKSSEVILDKAIEALKSNNNIILEVESHTDAMASDEYNLDLSQKRATHVVDYIQKKGIDKKRLFPKGMGEAQLVNHCANGIDCSDEEHKQNRRTIFKLIYK